MATVKFQIEGDEVVVRMPIDEASVRSAPRSLTGKSWVICQTGGFVDVGRTVAGRGLRLTASLIAVTPRRVVGALLGCVLGAGVAHAGVDQKAMCHKLETLYPDAKISYSVAKARFGCNKVKSGLTASLKFADDGEAQSFLSGRGE